MQFRSSAAGCCASERNLTSEVHMKRVVLVAACAVALGATVGFAQNLPWNNPGGPQGPAPGTTAPAGQAPKRDISGIWDAGGGGIGARGMQTSPLTPAGDALGKTHHSG